MDIGNDGSVQTQPCWSGESQLIRGPGKSLE
jgi:hypothetical protein